jgi:hypothetical protein
VAKNGRKVKAIALLFIFGYFFKNEKWAKNGRKIKELALLFCHFFTPFFKIEKVGINIQNVNGLRKQSFMTFLDKLSIEIWSAAFLEV